MLHFYYLSTWVGCCSSVNFAGSTSIYRKSYLKSQHTFKITSIFKMVIKLYNPLYRDSMPSAHSELRTVWRVTISQRTTRSSSVRSDRSPDVHNDTCYISIASRSTILREEVMKKSYIIGSYCNVRIRVFRKHYNYWHKPLYSVVILKRSTKVLFIFSKISMAILIHKLLLLF